MDGVRWLYFDIGSIVVDETAVYDDIFQKIADAAGVPAEYADKVAAACLAAEVIRVPQGESSKNFDCFHRILSRMLSFGSKTQMEKTVMASKASHFHALARIDESKLIL